MDRILIKGLRVFSYIGVNPEEKRDGQPFDIDLELYADLSKAGQSDDLNDTVNYAKVAKLAAEVLGEQKYDLVEKAAQCIVEEIFAHYGLVERVKITLKKPQAPMRGEFEYVGVLLDRRR